MHSLDSPNPGISHTVSAVSMSTVHQPTVRHQAGSLLHVSERMCVCHATLWRHL